MQSSYPVPFDQLLGPELLRSYGIADSATKPALEGLAAMIARHFQVPMVQFSLADAHRNWFRRDTGLVVSETAEDSAFSNHTLRDEAVFRVLDAREDARFHEDPLVAGDAGRRFYAGVRLVTPEGVILGTLCLLDREPWQAFSDDAAGDLQAFADIAMQRIRRRTRTRTRCPPRCARRRSAPRRSARRRSPWACPTPGASPRCMADGSTSTPPPARAPAPG